MERRRWQDLSERTRRVLVSLVVFEGLLKVIALVDLRRRPAAEVHGSKRLWAIAIVLVNSVGALPGAYLVWGRHRSATPS